MSETRNIKMNIDIKATIDLSEGALRALDALVGYGIEPFLKVFYRDLGKAYMEPYEKDLRTLFKDIGNQVGPSLGKIEALRDHLGVDQHHRPVKKRPK